MKSTVIIPTYNEADNIQALVSKILSRYPDFGIIIVDDNSPDGTGKIADSLAEKYPTLIRVVHRPCKAGLGRAYVHGFKVALDMGADFIFEMDADFSHDPVYLRDFLEAIETADLVIGSRYINGIRVAGWPFRRLLLSKLANIFVSHIVAKPVSDFTAGFRCYKRKVLESLDLNKIRSDGYAFQIEMTCLTFKHGFRVQEIPILFRERAHGYSKISKDVIWEAFWLTLRCHSPLIEIVKHVIFTPRLREFVKNHDPGVSG